ncbi:MAG TPA: 30S ribosomal protein THX [Candidatus Saccharimonadia bacterium]|nr:30S ribosomal protein THX [Candidatus Saccharimonadia bacterium]
MGRGDRKTRKGKTSISSYGKTRPHAARGGAKKTTVAKKTVTRSAGSRPATPAAKRPAAPARRAPAKKAGA